MKTSWLLMSAFFLAACVNYSTEPNSEASCANGQSVWFADDNSMILEVVGNRSIVTNLNASRYFGAVSLSLKSFAIDIASNTFASDGSLELRKDNRVLLVSIGNFSHSKQEIYFVFEKKPLKFVKIPTVKLSELAGFWLLDGSKATDDVFYIFEIKENGYHQYKYTVNHEDKTYSYYRDDFWRFIFIDSYKFLEGPWGSNYFFKRFVPGKELEYVGPDGRVLKGDWHPEQTQLIPEGYKLEK